MQALDDCIKEIRDVPNISTWKEAQVKEWIIRPILDLLGWGRREIIPEYDVETQSVDYTLQIKEKNKVFIEAKSPKKDLNRKKYQDQLFNYSARKNPDLAILTDGTLWWFYLPRAEGDWNDRKFYTINISEHEIEDIVGKFDLLLSRKNVESGEAIQHAKSILKSRRREIRENLPQATPTKHPDAKTSRETGNQTGNPKRMQIGSENYEFRYKKEILINTANWLIDKGDLKSSDCPVDIGIQAKIIVIDKNLNTLKEPRELKNGLYIEYQYSRRAPEFAQRLLKKYCYDPTMLQIEY